MLLEQEGQQHEHAPIVDDPPNINVALSEGLRIAWVEGHILGHQQGQACSCGDPDGAYGDKSGWRSEGTSGERGGSPQAHAPTY